SVRPEDALLISQFAQTCFAIRPSLAHLDVNLEMHRLLEERLNILARFGSDTLHVCAAGTKQYGSMAFAFDQDTRGNTCALLDFFPLLDDYGAPVGQLVPDQAEDLLAQQLCGDEADRPVGEGLGVEHGFTLGKPRGNLAQQVIELNLACRAHRHYRRVRMLGDDLAYEGEHRILVLEQVDLVDNQYGMTLLGQQGQQLFVARRPFAGLNDMQHHIDLGQGLCDNPVHHAVHGTAVTGLEARSINEYKLFVFARKNAVNSMTCGLC